MFFFLFSELFYESSAKPGEDGGHDTVEVCPPSENIKPAFTKKLKFQSALEGEPLELNCKIVAFPPPTILWFHNNKCIPKTRRRQVRTINEVQIHTTTLLVDSVKEKDAGSYKVMAINTEGSAESAASLLVSVNEEHSVNYVSTARRSARAQSSTSGLFEQCVERKFRVDLRCVGSPFDKRSKARHSRNCRTQTSLVRSLFFGSCSRSEDKATENKSVFLETSSERALSPPPMFDHSEHFNDRFSDIYCDRRTGARFSDKLSDRCSDRYSERFSDTDSLHNEVRAKLTTLQKAVKQRKRLSISTMSSSEFELDSVASESSYSDCMERLRGKPASLSVVQHFSRPFDLGETHRELQSKASASSVPQHRARHSFEPQSRTRAIQIMKGELFDTLVDKDLHSVELTVGSSVKQMETEDTNLVPEAELHHESQEAITTNVSRTNAKEFVSSEVLTSEEIFKTYTEESPSESLMGPYDKSLETDRIESDEKLLALRVKKWQQGGHMSEKCDPSTDQLGLQGTEGMEPNQNTSLTQVWAEEGSAVKLAKMSFSYQKIPEVKTKFEDSGVLSAPKTPLIDAKHQQTEMFYTSMPLKSTTIESREENGTPFKLEQRSQRIAKRATEVNVVDEDQLVESGPSQVQSRERNYLSESLVPNQKVGTTKLYDDFAGESLRAHYEKSLEAERLHCEEKLLALRIRKWQQGMQMEASKTEFDLPLPKETSYIQPGGQAAETRDLFGQKTKSPKVRREGEHGETSVPLSKDKIPTKSKESYVVTTTITQKSPRLECKGSEVNPNSGLVQTEKMLFDKTKEECELQLSRENISELKTESERLVSEEEALTQRIMKWQQDVLLEQGQSVELQPDWVQSRTLSQANKTSEDKNVAKVSAVKSIQEPVGVHGHSSSAGQTAKDKFLMSESFLDGFQGRQSVNLPWLAPGELLPEDGEARLQSGSEYLVSEEEALAQRILKWQEEVEQEEVAELEPDLNLDSPQLPTGPFELSVRSSDWEPECGQNSNRIHLGKQSDQNTTPLSIAVLLKRSDNEHVVPSPYPCEYTFKTSHNSASADPPEHIAGLTKPPMDSKTPLKDCSVSESFQKHSLSESRDSQSKHRVTVNEFSGQVFQSDICEETLFHEEMTTFREIGELDHQKAFEGEKRSSIKSLQYDKEKNANTEELVKSQESVMEQKLKSSTCGSQPFFAKEMSSIEAKLGEITEFTCQFHGKPPPTVSWLKDGHPITHNPDFDISNRENSSQLTIFYPTKDHEGSYDCVITNKHGKSICSATLEISDKKTAKKSGITKKATEDLDMGEKSLEVLTEKKNLTHVDSGMAVLQVPQVDVYRRRSSEYFSSCSPVEIRVTAATPVPMAHEEESCQNEPLTLAGKSSDVSIDDVSSHAFRHKFTFSFDAIGEAPFMVSELEDISCSEGNTFALECTISGEPKPEVTWCYGNNFILTKSGKYRVEEDDKINRLYVSNFTYSDAGIYKCVARNKLGEVTSISNVSVRLPPAGSVADDGQPAIHDKSLTTYPAVKAKKSRPEVPRELPAISGCGLPTSSAVIKVSQIKQAFEPGLPGLQMIVLEESHKQVQFPEEFIPNVEASFDLQSQELEPVVDKKHPTAVNQPVSLGFQTPVPKAEESHTPQNVLHLGKRASPLSLATLKTVPEISPEKEAAYHEVGAGRQHCAEDILKFPQLVKPEPLKPALGPKQKEEGEIVETREQTWQTFDRTSSFIPFQSEKVGPIKRSIRVSGAIEASANFKESNETSKPGRPFELARLPTSDIDEDFTSKQVLEDSTELNTHTKLEGICKETVVIPEVHHETDKTEPVSIPEPSVDCGISLGLLGSKAGITGIDVGITGDTAEQSTERKDKDEIMNKSVEQEPATLLGSLVEERCIQLAVPKDSAGDVPQSQDPLREKRVSLENTSQGEAMYGSLEEEEVTFGAVFDYYNPPTDWGRPLSPESEMSIEIGSTVSEEIAEVAERFYTPGSSTEVSQSIAEGFYNPKSPTYFHSPGSDAIGGFKTPQEYTLSPLENKRPSTGDSSDRFFSPLQFLPSPVDENIETTPLIDNNLLLSKGRGSLSLPSLQEKVQGIPPAFLKPLMKKRVLENDSLTFYAEVFGLPSPEVKWFCNKRQLLSGETVKIDRDGDCISLTIFNVTKADQGEYICEAANYVGEARSVALVVVVPQEIRFMPAPPAVTHQHVMEFDVEEDDSSRSPSPQEILLEVELDEIEVKEFEKQVKIITIPEYTADNKSMIISLDVLPSIYEEGAVDFVTQEHDDLKIAFEVTEMPPRFINPICDMETPEGTTVLFECSLMGIPSPIVSWFKGDKKIPHNKKYLLSSDGDTHFLRISKVSVADSGVYSCRAINLVGETLCRASLVVLSAKAFSGRTRGRELTAVSLGSAKVQPQKFDLRVGNTSFDGEHVSEIELEFEFEQEQDESQRSVRLVANTNNETSDQGDKYVSINFDVFAEPSKEDRVEFKGKSSDACSFQFQVTETPPRCIIPLSNVTAAVGTPVILQCLVSGKPNPSAYWYKDGNRVTDSRCIIQEKTAGHFNLLITNASQSDAGEYKCVIQNSSGCIETTALLKVF